MLRANRTQPPERSEGNRRPPPTVTKFTHVVADPAEGPRLVEEAVCQLCFGPMSDTPRRQRIEWQLEQRYELLSQLNPPADEMVRLVVSGRTFVVGRRTLCQDGESVLAQMLTAPNRQLHTTAGGQVVLDVDADAFAQIVLWLRTGVAPRGHTVDEAAVLRHYAKVLSLRGLVAALGGEPAPPTEAQPSDPAVGSFPDASPKPSLDLADASSGPPNAGDRQPNFTQTRLLECMQVRLVLFAPLGRLTSHTGGV